jgi:predicted transcriptional regulator
MSVGQMQTIEVDEDTAATLTRHAASQGLSVAELVADMTVLQFTPMILPAKDIAELDGQWAAIKAGEPTTAHEDVARWLQSWGTPAFRPWRER